MGAIAALGRAYEPALATRMPAMSTNSTCGSGFSRNKSGDEYE
jgi:hypothetical protein